jgi:hypothetical protein
MITASTAIIATPVIINTLAVFLFTVFIDLIEEVKERWWLGFRS